jgi:cyclin A
MSRRAALGVLTNQTNQPIQRHIAKQQHNKDVNILNENESQKQFDFEIFEDKENIKSTKTKNEFQIFCDSTTVTTTTTFQQIKKPLQTIFNPICDISKDSPMVLDDTIKNQTKSDSLEDFQIDDDEDEEEEFRRQQIEQRELELKNCEEYAREILEHLKELELVNKPKANYIKQQADITSSMRSILVDWLVEVCEEYKLHTETLYLAVNYTDRFLSKMSVLRGKLQLLGTASIYIASKYEEIFPPDVNEFVYITDDTYKKEQVLRMEHLILKVLNFHMNAPTANCFLLHFIQFSKCSKKIEHLARYLAELTLIEADPFLEFLPSQIATSSLYLSMLILNKREWNLNDMFELTGYRVDNKIKSCVNEIYKAMCNASTHAQQAIQEKYRSERFDCVSLIEPPKNLIF